MNVVVSFWDPLHVFEIYIYIYIYIFFFFLFKSAPLKEPYIHPKKTYTNPSTLQVFQPFETTWGVIETHRLWICKNLGPIHPDDAWQELKLFGSLGWLFGTVDASEIRRENQLNVVVYPIIRRVLYIPGGCLGFLSSRVSGLFKGTCVIWWPPGGLQGVDFFILGLQVFAILMANSLPIQTRIRNTMTVLKCCRKSACLPYYGLY